MDKIDNVAETLVEIVIDENASSWVIPLNKCINELVVVVKELKVSNERIIKLEDTNAPQENKIQNIMSENQDLEGNFSRQANR